MTYAAELHGKQYRSRVVMWASMMQSIASAGQAGKLVLDPQQV